ncbi:hypothetical protein ABT301_04100 [Streptomyces sp. NPDC000987]|uniref:hypothetical protein n=1 Tax=Streptomyces sp. NPDC000987 TaxID=3154374 RepID=UPI00331B08E4
MGESSEETSPGYDSASSHGHRRTPAARASASARPEPSRAGSRAGEGRERPGRRWWDEQDEESEEDQEDQDADRQGDYPGKAYPDRQDTADEPNASATPQDATPGDSSPTSQSTQQAASHAEAPTEPVLRILPLGSGLVLIGLGLGLAFVGLRLRRG